MLESDANLSSTDIDPALTQARLAHYNKIANEMHLDDLPLLESELEFNEKVSVLFLLNGSAQETSQLLLQRLIVALHAPSYATNYIQEWARTASDWPRTLVEALAIVQANRVILRLGLDGDVINTLDLLPRRPDIASRVHPILKWLYYICEQLIPDDTGVLITFVCAKFPDERYRLRNIPEPTERYMEIWFLLWLSERLIDVGDWAPNASARNRKIHCRLDAILVAMKTSGNATLMSLHHRLESAQIRFNCTTTNVIGFDPKSPEKLREINEKRKSAREQQLGDGDATYSSVNSGIVGPNTTNIYSNDSNEDTDDGDRYTIRPHKIGIALIINQDTFHMTKVFTFYVLSITISTLSMFKNIIITLKLIYFNLIV